MKTLVIIDDEFYFRKSMRSYLEKGNQFTVVGEANNGVTGQELILSLKPDIALVDISMPLADGLTMIQALKDRSYTYFILLTGYGEFEYARQAIALGVQDYLLKPVDYDELIEALNKVSIKIDRQQHQETIKSNFYLYRDKYFQQIDLNIFSRIQSGRLTTAEFEEFKSASMLRNCTSFMVLIIKIAQTGSSVWALDDDADLCHYILKNISSETFEKNRIPSLPINYAPDLQYLILGFSDTDPIADQTVRKICRKLMNVFKEIAHIPSSLFLGLRHSGPEGIRSSYEEAAALLQNNNYRSLTVFRAFAGDGQPRSFQPDERNKLRRELLTALRRNDTPSVFKLIEDCFKTLHHAPYHSKELQVTGLLFITILDEFLGEQQLDRKETDKLQYAMNIYESCASLEALKELIIETYDEILAYLNDRRTSPRNKLTDSVKSYIAAHYAEADLQLKTIAAALYISPQHLSAVFSQETGTPLSTYIMITVCSRPNSCC